MTGTLERILQRDRMIVTLGLVIVIALSWIYVLLGAGMKMSAFQMTEMSGPAGSALHNYAQASSMMASAMQPAAWTLGYAVLMVFMWWIMMVAMMIPSAAATILLYASISRRQSDNVETLIPTGVFTLGYILVWGIFSLIATGLQWALQQAELLSAALSSNSILLGGVLLCAAGLWQMTPLKHACLQHCRSPMDYLSRSWRHGRLGALQMGLEHGVYCLGCCWVLMGLLFVGGVMNLFWILGLAFFVFVEKTLPYGPWFRWVTGCGLMICGGILIFISLA